MNTIEYQNNIYINGDYILENAPIYSKGVRSSRDLVKKKNIDKTLYIYARYKDNNWIISDGKSAKFDKVFINKQIFLKLVLMEILWMIMMLKRHLTLSN